MKKNHLLLAVFVMGGFTAFAQPGAAVSTTKETKLPPSKVDFDAFDSLTREVKEYRKNRLVSLVQFLSFAKEKNTIILDTRSAEMYNRKHIKGAVHLNFSDFTETNLRRLIPSPGTRILIYCNNNFADDQVTFATKSYSPRLSEQKKPITLALNIPTFINLYGYGYKNVYELSDLVSVFSGSIQFEGTDVLNQTSRKGASRVRSSAAR
ncbi:MAG TPA: rhodanese-like domain-containing protein [Chitinophagaceae bacterium]